MKKFVPAIVAIALFFQIPLQAAYLTYVPQSLKQPDGKTLNCFATGDEFHNWLHDANNFTIIQDSVTGYYVYAAKPGSKLVPTSYIAGQVDPASAGLQPGLNLDPAEVEAMVAGKFKAPELKGFSGSATIGSLNNIVIFIRFSDQSEYTNPITTYSSAFNANSGVSMAEYFKAVSGSQLYIATTFYPKTSGTTAVSYQDAHPRGYYLVYNATTNTLGYQNSTESTDREMTLLKNATESVASQIEATGLDFDLNDDGKIDNVCFVVQGAAAGWSDLLWPHMWSLYAYTVQVAGARVYSFNFQLSQSFGVSVLCHEMSHSLGFPDLYHYTSNSITPVGQWDVMASNGTPPQHQNSYCKSKYGKWFSSLPVISTAGTYTLEPLSTNPFAGYKIVSPKSKTEFFVVEYRKKTGTFETSLPGSGLIIYRVNTAANGNASGPPDEIYVYRPNGTTTVDGSISTANFSSGTGRTSFTATSNPACFLSDGSPGGIEITHIGEAGETITFTLGYPIPTPTLTVTPATQNVVCGGETTAFAVTNTGEATMNWTAVVATAASGWLHITSGASGTNTGTITVLADQNHGTSSRTGSITVTSDGAYGSPKTVNVIQSGDPSILTVSPDSRNVANTGGATTFTVSNAGGGSMSWTAVVNTGSSWLHISSGSTGTNSGTIRASYDANPADDPRTGVILLTAPGANNSPATLTIEQAGKQTALIVTPEIQNVICDASSTSFAVNNLGEGTMNWTATVMSGSSWARITSGAEGANAGTVIVSFDANPGNDVRAASITITAPGASGNPKTVTVVQTTSPPILSVLPDTRSMDFEASLVTFFVSNTGAGTMSWTSAVTTGSSWIRITSGSSGTNAGTISAVVDTNSDNVIRTGIITITADGTTDSPKTVIITQYTDLSGIGQPKMANSYRVYPNPSNDKVTVELINYRGSGQKLEVLNMMGQLEMMQILNQENSTLDLSGLSDGIYFFRMTPENQTPVVIKVIKN